MEFNLLKSMNYYTTHLWHMILYTNYTSLKKKKKEHNILNFHIWDAMLGIPRQSSG